MSDICEVWEYCSLRDDFLSVWQKFYRAAIFWWVYEKSLNFGETFSFESGSQNIVPPSLLFVKLI